MNAQPRSISVPDHVLVEHLPNGESVFLNLVTEEYFGLDEVGTSMWKALKAAGSAEGAVEPLLDEFDVDRESLIRDLDALLRRLADQGLVRIGDEPVGTGTPTPAG